MRPTLTAEMAQTVIDDRVAAAESFRRRKQGRGDANAIPDTYDAVTVRFAGEDDNAALRDLAERDGRRAPRRPMLVAEVHGELLAARSLADGGSIADPFRHTAHLTEMLALRTAHLRGEGELPTRRRSRRAWGRSRAPARA